MCMTSWFPWHIHLIVFLAIAYVFSFLWRSTLFSILWFSISFFSEGWISYLSNAYSLFCVSPWQCHSTHSWIVHTCTCTSLYSSDKYMNLFVISCYLCLHSVSILASKAHKSMTRKLLSFIHGSRALVFPELPFYLYGMLLKWCNSRGLYRHAASSWSSIINASVWSAIVAVHRESTYISGSCDWMQIPACI